MTVQRDFDSIPNGPAGAAILAAGIGSLALGLFAILGDAVSGIGRMFIFYRPTGPLSGVTTSTIAIWLIAWWILGKSWAEKTVNVAIVNTVAFVGLLLGVLLTFPPFMDLLQGK